MCHFLFMACETSPMMVLPQPAHRSSFALTVLSSAAVAGDDGTSLPVSTDVDDAGEADTEADGAAGAGATTDGCVAAGDCCCVCNRAGAPAIREPSMREPPSIREVLFFLSL